MSTTFLELDETKLAVELLSFFARYEKAVDIDGSGSITITTPPKTGGRIDRATVSEQILYEIHDIHRFPTVQDFASYARLVKCAKESAGKRTGTSGKKIGNAHLKWAFSEAAVLFLRQNPQAQAWLKKAASKHGKPKALSILAHKLGRTVYYLLHRDEAFDMQRFLAA